VHITHVANIAHKFHFEIVKQQIQSVISTVGGISLPYFGEIPSLISWLSVCLVNFCLPQEVRITTHFIVRNDPYPADRSVLDKAKIGN
jgi:hypothetical protein